MAVTIINYSDKTFKLNGIEYQKNFQSLVYNDLVKIVNIYDVSLELVSKTDYSEFTIDGNTFASAELLQSALIDVLFYSMQEQYGGLVENLENDVETLFAAQTGGLKSFTTLALLQAYATPNVNDSYKVTNDTTTSNNGYYHWVSGTNYVKDANLVVSVLNATNTSDGVSGKAVADYSATLRGGTVASGETKDVSGNEVWKNINKVDLISICTLSNFYRLTAGVLTKSTSTGWRSSGMIPIKYLGTYVSTYVDAADKPAIMYFTGETLDTYISSETTVSGTNNITPTIPATANYFIVQCLYANISGKFYKSDTSGSILSNLKYDTYPLISSNNLVKSGMIYNVSLKTLSLSKFCAFDSYYRLSSGVLTLNESTSFRNSGFVSIEYLKGVLSTYVDATDKPAVMYFTGETLDTYISSETTVSGTNNITPTIPATANYFIVQCLYANISGQYITTLKSFYSDENYNYENINLVDVAIANRFYRLTDGVLTLNNSTNWRSTPFTSVDYLKGSIYTYVDAADKPAIMYFTGETLDTYISSETNYLKTFGFTPTIPATANYFIIQCRYANISGQYYKSDTYGVDYFNLRKLDEIESSFYNVNKMSVLAKGTNDWTDVIQYGLDNYNNIFIPYSETPYEISSILKIKSNTSILAAKGVVLKSISGVSRIFENATTFGETYDSNISIDGITFDVNGNTHAMRMFGVDNLTIKNVVVNNAAWFCMHLNGITNLIIDNLELNDGGSDGIHLGDVNYFSINNVRGTTHDDFIALNAWDWQISTKKYGDIKNGSISNIYCDYTTAHVIRCQSGTVTDSTTYENGTFIVDNVTFKNINGEAGLYALDFGYNPPLGTEDGTSAAAKQGSFHFEDVNVKSDLESIRIGCDLQKLTFDRISGSSSYPSRGVLRLETGNTIDIVRFNDFIFDKNWKDDETRNFYFEFLGSVVEFKISNSKTLLTSLSSKNLFFFNSVKKIILDSNNFQSNQIIANIENANDLDIILINNTFKTSNSVIKFITAGVSSRIKLLTNNFKGYGFIVNNSVSGFTPTVKDLANTSELTNSSGSVTWN